MFSPITITKNFKLTKFMAVSAMLFSTAIIGTYLNQAFAKEISQNKTKIQDQEQVIKPEQEVVATPKAQVRDDHKIGFFTDDFNPATIEKVAIARIVKDTLGLDTLTLHPRNYVSVPNGSMVTAATYGQRKDLLNLTLKDLKVSDLEVGVNYTADGYVNSLVDSFSLIRKDHDENQPLFYVLPVTDICKLEHWQGKSPEIAEKTGLNLIRDVNLVIVDRSRVDYDYKKISPALESFILKYAVHTDDLNFEKYLNDPSGHLFIITYDVDEVPNETLLKALKKGDQKFLKEHMTKSALKYVKDKKLYNSSFQHGNLM